MQQPPVSYQKSALNTLTHVLNTFTNQVEGARAGDQVVNFQARNIKYCLITVSWQLAHSNTLQSNTRKKLKCRSNSNYVYWYEIFKRVRQQIGSQPDYFFILHYKLKLNHSLLPLVAACTSGEYLNGFSGFFSTPNFPRNYPQYSRCTWNITVPSGYIIKLSFFYFRLEPKQ